MKASIVACKTIENEIVMTMDKLSVNHPVHWIESGLHNYPERLRSNLQETIGGISGSDYTIMLFGLCGNALLGISSTESCLVVPRVDDCISLLLGGNDNRKQLERRATSYYLTKGWLTYENNIWQEYLKSVDKYGKEKTRSLFQVMLKYYTHLVVIDTGAYDTESFLEETKLIAEELNLSQKVVPADLTLLEKALQGDWSNSFSLVKPGTTTSLQNLGKCTTLVNNLTSGSNPT